MILSLLLAANSVTTIEPQSVRIEYRTERTAPRGDALLKQTMLQMHNQARKQVAQPPLKWDPVLTKHAKRYAIQLARRGVFEHAARPANQPIQGENLWTGTRGAFAINEMSGHWIGERRNFINGPIPHISRTGNFTDVGHYTQIIWPSTTHMGCAMASNATDDYLVCRYYPAGNVWGERAIPQRRGPYQPN